MARRRTAAAVLTGIVLSLGTVGLASPASAAASCPDNGWSIKDGRYGKYFAVNSVNIRTGPGTNCTSIGQGQKSHNVQLDCWKAPGDGYTWSHLYDFTTSRGGWVRDDLLVGYGANVHC